MSVPATSTAIDGSGPAGEGHRVLRELTTAESLDLLSSVAMGRVVFTDRALPAIRPVNHLVDAGDVIIRTSLGTRVVVAVAATDDIVVAYEADSIDPVARVGWSVVVTGVARLVSDPQQIQRYERTLRPWVSGSMDRVIRIHPEIVTGYRLLNPAG